MQLGCICKYIATRKKFLYVGTMKKAQSSQFGLLEEQKLSAGQKKFLQMAQEKNIDPNLFGEFVPEIQYEHHLNPELPTIAYIHTGGTLMMVPSKQFKDTLSFEGALDIHQVMEVCDLTSNIKQRYNILGIYLANRDSKEIDVSLWTSIATTIYTLYDRIDGAVVGHGTHTLEYSSAAVAYALQNIAIPVVFTASQIPIIGFPGSDGLMNLTGAMEIAAKADIAEVVAYANGQVFRGTRVTKKNDSRLDIFEARVTGPLAYYTSGGVDVRPRTKRRNQHAKSDILFQPSFSKFITAIKIQPGMSKEVLRTIISTGKDVGLILETYGSGAIPKDLIAEVKKYSDQGFPIFVTSSCAESGISSGMQQHDEDAIAAYEAGIRNVGDMSTTAAIVKLMHVVGNDSNIGLEKIREEMTKKAYAGEMTM